MRTGRGNRSYSETCPSDTFDHPSCIPHDTAYDHTRATMVQSQQLTALSQGTALHTHVTQIYLGS
jgi:hypothetical protein